MNQVTSYHGHWCLLLAMSWCSCQEALQPRTFSGKAAWSIRGHARIPATSLDAGTCHNACISSVPTHRCLLVIADVFVMRCRFISASAKLEQHPLLKDRVHERDGRGTLAALSNALQRQPVQAGDWGVLFARAGVLPDDRDNLRQFLLMVDNLNISTMNWVHLCPARAVRAMMHIVLKPPGHWQSVA